MTYNVRTMTPFELRKAEKKLHRKMREAGTARDYAKLEALAEKRGMLTAAVYAGSGEAVNGNMGKLADRLVANSIPPDADKKAKAAIEQAVIDGLYLGETKAPRIIVRESATADLGAFELEEYADRLALGMLAKKRAVEKLAELDAGDDAAGPVHVVVADLGDDIEAPKPSAGSVREDGVPLFYAAAVNMIGGEPGGGKTILAALSVVETMQRGGRALWHDYDHNGARATIARLVAAGADIAVLRDPERFRLLIGESPAQILASVAEADGWLGEDDIAIVDSVGELVAMFGGNSNDADDYTRIFRQVPAPLAETGAAVVLCDHLAKTATGTGYTTGTGAKKRTLDGAFYTSAPFRDEPPRPESVGKLSLTLLKDRHGGTGYGVGECVAVLELDSRDSANGPWSWRLMPGRPKEERNAEQASADVDFVLALDPFPTSRAKLHAALVASQGKGWRADREQAALDEAKRRRDTTVTFPLETTTKG